MSLDQRAPSEHPARAAYRILAVDEFDPSAQVDVHTAAGTFHGTLRPSGQPGLLFVDSARTGPVIVVAAHIIAVTT